MKNSIMFFGILILGLFCTSCDPPAAPCERDYLFSIPVTLSPASDTFQVGDTICLSMKFPIRLEDINTNEFFDLHDFPFNTSISHLKLDTTPALCANALVKFVEKQGRLDLIPLSVGCLATVVNYDTREDSLFFAVDIILRSEGLYGVGCNSSFLEEYTLPIQESCKTKSVEIHYSLNPIGGDSNFDFLQYSKDVQKKNLSKPFFDSDSGFVFFVTD